MGSTNNNACMSHSLLDPGMNRLMTNSKAVLTRTRSAFFYLSPLCGSAGHCHWVASHPISALVMAQQSDCYSALPFWRAPMTNDRTKVYETGNSSLLLSLLS